MAVYDLSTRIATEDLELQSKQLQELLQNDWNCIVFPVYKQIKHFYWGSHNNPFWNTNWKQLSGWLILKKSYITVWLYKDKFWKGIPVSLQHRQIDRDQVFNDT